MLAREAIFDRLMGAQGLFSDSTLESLRAGHRYWLRAATGDLLRGRVEFVVPPRGFCVTIENLNDALFWLSIEGAAPPREAGLWLSCYGIAKAEVEAFGAHWSKVNPAPCNEAKSSFYDKSTRARFGAIGSTSQRTALDQYKENGPHAGFRDQLKTHL